jgi:LAS superfamily LD-carboxypeptidase LdcB
MTTPSTNKHRFLTGLLIALPLVLIVGFGFFIVSMYQRDMRALTDFVASYQAYDRAIATASTPIFSGDEKNPSTASAEEQQAEAALAILKDKSTARISSLTKNESEAMRTMQAIAQFAGKEMSTLEAYRQALAHNANGDALAQSFQQLTKERQSAFAYFQGLGQKY